MTNSSDDAYIGRRLREIRSWRGLSVQALAELAGFSKSYLSMIERGLRPVDSRSTLEALASALRVAPHELVGTPLLVAGIGSEHAAVVSLRSALSEFDPDDGDTNPAPWPKVQAEIAKVTEELRPHADYVNLSMMLPELLRDLYASLDGPHRRDALLGLVECYLGALSACKSLGFPDLAHAAALRLRDVSRMLAGPEWAGLAAYARAQAIGSGARERARTLSVRAADAISPELDRPEVAEVYGMLHLMAALGCTTQGRLDLAEDHVSEAAETAGRPNVGSRDRMRMRFGAGNIGFWRTALAVERGESGQAIEIARAIDPDTMPAAPSRHAAWWIDIGRAMAIQGKSHREEAVRSFRRAEDIAPQLTRASPWVRETVTSLLGHARRDAGGRELRGLAHRIGLDVAAP